MLFALLVFQLLKFNEVNFITAVRRLQNMEQVQDNAYTFLRSGGVIDDTKNLQFCYWNYREDQLYIHNKGNYDFHLFKDDKYIYADQH